MNFHWQCLLNVVIDNCIVIAKDKVGCCVLQQCVDYCCGETKGRLIAEIIGEALVLAQDRYGFVPMKPYQYFSYSLIMTFAQWWLKFDVVVCFSSCPSNYVLQHLLGLRTPQVTSILLRQLQGNYMFLSCSKYGSNVVEKCLLESGEEQSAEIIKELCRSPNISMLLTHPFGNYVFQTALSVSKVRLSKALLCLDTH